MNVIDLSDAQRESVHYFDKIAANGFFIDDEFQHEWSKVTELDFPVHTLNDIFQCFSRLSTTSDRSLERTGNRKVILTKLPELFNLVSHDLNKLTLTESNKLIETAIRLRIIPPPHIMSALDNIDTKRGFGNQSYRDVSNSLFLRARLRQKPSDEYMQSMKQGLKKIITNAQDPFILSRTFSALVTLHALFQDPQYETAARQILDSIRNPGKFKTSNLSMFLQGSFWLDDKRFEKSVPKNKARESNSKSRLERRWKSHFKRAGYNQIITEDRVRIGHSHAFDFGVNDHPYFLHTEIDGGLHTLWHFNEKNGLYEQGPYNGSTIFQSYLIRKALRTRDSGKQEKLLRIRRRTEEKARELGWDMRDVVREIVKSTEAHPRNTLVAYINKDKGEIGTRSILEPDAYNMYTFAA